MLFIFLFFPTDTRKISHTPDFGIASPRSFIWKMATCNDGHHSMRDFTESVNSIMDQILELSLLYDCQTYFLVEHDHGILTFNSVEDGSWPPPDHTMVSYAQ